MPDEGDHKIPDAEEENKLEDEEARLNAFNPILYTRGQESDCFHLILSGKVNVNVGHEGFNIMHSSFNYLGAEALIRDDY